MSSALKFCIIILLCQNLFSYDAKIVIDFNNNNTKKINPKNNGGFVEFLLDMINGPNGIWAQDLMDRGFDNNYYNTLNFTINWKKFISNSDSSLIEYPEGGYNENGTRFVKLKGKDQVKVGFYQEIFSENIDRDAYIYLKGEGIGKVFFKVFDINFNEIQSLELPFSNDWKKVEFKVNKYEKDPKVLVGWFVEGNAVVDFDEASVMDENIMGVRLDYHKLFIQWKPGIIRYPGGLYADLEGNDWEHAIGEIDKRKSPALSVEAYSQRRDWGIHEFLNYCEYLNCDVQFGLNYRTDPIDKTLNLLEYMNSDENTLQGKRRSTNGRKEPWNVTLLEIGNEVWDNYEPYLNDYILISKKIKETFPKSRTMVTGNIWDENYHIKTKDIVGNNIDSYSIHPSVSIILSDTNNSSVQYISNIGLTKGLINFCDSFVKYFKDFNNSIMLAPNEWWCNYYNNYITNEWLWDIEDKSNNLSFGISAAIFQNYLYQNSDDFIMAAKTIGIGHIKRRINKNGFRVIFPNVQFYSLALFSNHIGDYIIPSESITPKFGVFNNIAWVSDVPYFESLVTADKDFIYINLINTHPDEVAKVNINLPEIFNNINCKLYQIYSDNIDDKNMADDPNKIGITEQNILFTNNEIAIPKHSVNVLVIPNLIGLNLPKVKNGYYISDDFITLDSNIKEYKLFDLNGKLIKENDNFNASSIYISYLQKGMYFLILNNNESIIKFIKQ